MHNAKTGPPARAEAHVVPKRERVLRRQRHDPSSWCCARRSGYLHLLAGVPGDDLPIVSDCTGKAELEPLAPLRASKHGEHSGGIDRRCVGAVQAIERRRERETGTKIPIDPHFIVFELFWIERGCRSAERGKLIAGLR